MEIFTNKTSSIYFLCLVAASLIVGCGEREVLDQKHESGIKFENWTNSETIGIEDENVDTTGESKNSSKEALSTDLDLDSILAEGKAILASPFLLSPNDEFMRRIRRYNLSVLKYLSLDQKLDKKNLESLTKGYQQTIGADCFRLRNCHRAEVFQRDLITAQVVAKLFRLQPELRIAGSNLEIDGMLMIGLSTPAEKSVKMNLKLEFLTRYQMLKSLSDPNNNLDRKLLEYYDRFAVHAINSIANTDLGAIDQTRISNMFESNDICSYSRLLNRNETFLRDMFRLNLKFYSQNDSEKINDCIKRARKVIASKENTLLELKQIKQENPGLGELFELNEVVGYLQKIPMITFALERIYYGHLISTDLKDLFSVYKDDRQVLLVAEAFLKAQFFIEMNKSYRGMSKVFSENGGIKNGQRFVEVNDSVNQMGQSWREFLGQKLIDIKNIMDQNYKRPDIISNEYSRFLNFVNGLPANVEVLVIRPTQILMLDHSILYRFDPPSKVTGVLSWKMGDGGYYSLVMGEQVPWLNFGQGQVQLSEREKLSAVGMTFQVAKSYLSASDKEIAGLSERMVSELYFRYNEHFRKLNDEVLNDSFKSASFLELNEGQCESPRYNNSLDELDQSVLNFVGNINSRSGQALKLFTHQQEVVVESMSKRFKDGWAIERFSNSVIAAASKLIKDEGLKERVRLHLEAKKGISSELHRVISAYNSKVAVCISRQTIREFELQRLVLTKELELISRLDDISKRLIESGLTSPEQLTLSKEEKAALDLLNFGSKKFNLVVRSETVKAGGIRLSKFNTVSRFAYYLENIDVNLDISNPSNMEESLLVREDHANVMNINTALSKKDILNTSIEALIGGNRPIVNWYRGSFKASFVRRWLHTLVLSLLSKEKNNGVLEDISQLTVSVLKMIDFKQEKILIDGESYNLIASANLGNRFNKDELDDLFIDDSTLRVQQIGTNIFKSAFEMTKIHDLAKRFYTRDHLQNRVILIDSLIDKDVVISNFKTDIMRYHEAGRAVFGIRPFEILNPSNESNIVKNHGVGIILTDTNVTDLPPGDSVEEFVNPSVVRSWLSEIEAFHVQTDGIFRKVN